MKWICVLCKSSARSKCVDSRSVFVEPVDGMDSVELMVVEATTLVQKTGDCAVECSIKTASLASLKNVVKLLAEHPRALDQCLCDHRWELFGYSDCDLKCGTNRVATYLDTVQNSLEKNK